MVFALRLGLLIAGDPGQVLEGARLNKEVNPPGTKENKKKVLKKMEIAWEFLLSPVNPARDVHYPLGFLFYFEGPEV